MRLIVTRYTLIEHIQKFETVNNYLHSNPVSLMSILKQLGLPWPLQRYPNRTSLKSRL